VTKLELFRNQIDDSIRRGRLELPLLGRDLLNRRITQVQTIIAELFQEKIDPTVVESIETDSKKISYAENLTELRERWRKIIKGQIFSRYISLREDDIGLDDDGKFYLLMKIQMSNCYFRPKRKWLKQTIIY